MDLYITAPPLESLEKSAAEVSLPEDANAWPTEIMQELFKQVPFIADFDPQVMMDRVDAERGYGFGHVEVQNKTELQNGAPDEQKKQIGIQHVRIPIIIKDRKLQPFDILVTAQSKALPLTEARLRQALFRPQAFDVTGRSPGDMSMVGQLYPPYRQNFGFGGGGVGMQAGMGKEGSAQTCEHCGKTKCSCSYTMKNAADHGGEHPTQEHFHAKLEKVLGLTPEEVAKLKGTQKTASSGVPNSTALSGGPSIKKIVPNLHQAVKLGSVLTTILPTISASDHASFLRHFEDRGVQAGFLKNAHASYDALQKLIEFDPSVRTTTKTAAALGSALRPTVTQVRKEAEGYSIKQASHLAWAPTINFADRGQVVRRFGEKVALAADLSGSVTLTDGEGTQASPEEHRAELVSGFGYYRVRTEEGQDLQGFVFPNLYDLDGVAVPMAIFSDGAHTAAQEAIVGERLTDNVPELDLTEEPSGHGVFVRLLDGAAEATIPLEVKGSYGDDNGEKYYAETFDGRDVFISRQPNIKVPVMMDDTCLIPEDYKWLPLGSTEDVSLVSDPSGWGQQKEAARHMASVTVRAGSDNSFSFNGPLVDKIASVDKAFVSLDDALFLLGGLGVNLNYASEKLAQALNSSSPVQIKVGRALTTVASLRKEAGGKAQEKLASFPFRLRKDLVKEAAFIPDPLAVDTVLSLGFINPENLTLFISYLPQIDSVQSQLCELLIAARLGLSEIPTGSLEKTVKSLEDTIEGLKTIAFTKS